MKRNYLETLGNLLRLSLSGGREQEAIEENHGRHQEEDAEPQGREHGAD